MNFWRFGVVFIIINLSLFTHKTHKISDRKCQEELKREDSDFESK